MFFYEISERLFTCCSNSESGSANEMRSFSIVSMIPAESGRGDEATSPAAAVEEVELDGVWTGLLVSCFS